VATGAAAIPSLFSTLDTLTWVSTVYLLRSKTPTPADKEQVGTTVSRRIVAGIALLVQTKDVETRSVKVLLERAERLGIADARMESRSEETEISIYGCCFAWLPQHTLLSLRNTNLLVSRVVIGGFGVQD
jgi:hypothetical protein